MSHPAQIAKHFRDVHFGGNWTYSNLRDNLSGLTWQQATTKVGSFNTIAVLVFHMNYYVDAIIKVMQSKPLEAHDKYSFDCPPIESAEDWEKLLQKTWTDAETFAGLVEQLPENRLWENMADSKYGNYYRNLHGVIEHCHYHLGQIALIRKMILKEDKSAKS